MYHFTHYLGSRHSDRVLLSPTERQEVLSLLSGDKSLEEFCALDTITSQGGGLLKELVEVINQVYPLQIPGHYHRYMLHLIQLVYLFCCRNLLNIQWSVSIIV